MSVQLKPMSAERLAEWIPSSQEAYRLSRIEAGESAELAGLRAAESTERFFGSGAPLPLHQVFDVVVADAGGSAVGHLWIGPQFGSTTDWWVWDIEIAAAHRRAGYARHALQLGEAEARALGAQSIGLNVFGYNTGAQALYAALGYTVAAVNMSKKLD